jgi:predicted TIM-barrel fold metal-dependent hydrolase
MSGREMSGRELSRRDALWAVGGAFASGVLAGARGSACAAAAEKPTPGEEIVDAHLHVVSARFAGAREEPVPLAPFDTVRDSEGPKRLAQTIRDEMTSANVRQGFCMPGMDVSDQDPLGIREVLAEAELVSGATPLRLHPVGLVHPERFDRGHLARVEEVLEARRVKALKVYLGYFHYEPDHAGYRPYYRLASKYQVPVILHTGDTWSRTAKVKYAHPLKIDDLAVDFPDTKFVLAHFGNPWVMDAAEVIFKNENVWADLSGILIGDARAFATMEKEGVLAREISRIREGIEFAEAPEKFLYGSDWPLSPMKVYCDFVRQLFPAQHHKAVFHENAKALFNL